MSIIVDQYVCVTPCISLVVQLHKHCVNFFLSCKKFNDTGCEAFSWSSSSSTTGTCVPYIGGVCREKFHILQQCLHVDSTGTIWVNKNRDNLNGLEHNLTYFITEIKSEWLQVKQHMYIQYIANWAKLMWLCELYSTHQLSWICHFCN